MRVFFLLERFAVTLSLVLASSAMRYFLQLFGVFWLCLTLPVVALMFTSKPPQDGPWWTYALLVVFAVAPGPWALYRSKAYPARDEFTHKVAEGSVIGGSISLARMLLKDPRGFWKSLQF
jgi:hypothetical protein